jgi:hypothetical protein
MALGCGVFECTVKNMSMEIRNRDIRLHNPSITHPGRPPMVLDAFFQGVIRIKVHSFYLRKVYQTVSNFYANLEINIESSSMSVSRPCVA